MTETQQQVSCQKRSTNRNISVAGIVKLNGVYIMPIVYKMHTI
jgi:hypothetical protein